MCRLAAALSSLLDLSFRRQHLKLLPSNRQCANLVRLFGYIKNRC